MDVENVSQKTTRFKTRRKIRLQRPLFAGPELAFVVVSLSETGRPAYLSVVVYDVRRHEAVEADVS